MDRIASLSQQISQNQCSDSCKVTIEYLENKTIGVIYFNSPKDLNCLSLQLETELSQSITELNNSQDVKVIVILSKFPKAFCAGADITRFTKMSTQTELISNTFQIYDNTLFKATKPVIAGVNGFCLGGGFEIALSADVIFCSEDAKFGFPEIKLGLIPGIGGTQRFTKIVGKVRANQYILSGQFFDAQKAKDMNVVADIYPKEKLHEEVLKYARDVAQWSMYTLITAKKAVNKSEDLGITEGISFERTLFSSLFNLPGSKEGVDAFLSKRKPNFNKI
ncbi:hypothetical protein ABPG72_005989 [Tetrahymena utriculariae]